MGFLLSIAISIRSELNYALRQESEISNNNTIIGITKAKTKEEKRKKYVTRYIYKYLYDTRSG